MRILQINCVYGKGSTGRIMGDIHAHLRAQGHESFILYGRGTKTDDPDVYKTCGEIYAKANKLLCRLTGLMYGGCRLSTRRLIGYIKKLQPDVVHLHCINGNFVNIYRLIQWLKCSGIPTVLTLHAEFMHTANCAYAYECEKWKTGCGSCPVYRRETGSLLFDRTAASWEKMRRAFDGFERLTLVSVSPWLQQRAEQSPFLGDKNNVVILNGLDRSVFKRCDTDALRRELGIGDGERIVFHATPNFSQHPQHIKGGRYVVELARRLVGQNIRFVVAGPYPDDLSAPDNLLLLGNVSDKQRLAQLYSMADVTLLTSKAETFSMIVAESLCCGTPIVGFCAGAPEQIALPDFSAFVPYGDTDALCNTLLARLEQSPDRERISAAAHQKYAEQTMCEQYLSIYQKMKK